MAYFPVNRTHTCDHPRPHKAVNPNYECYHDIHHAHGHLEPGCKVQTHCDGTPCKKDFDHHDQYMKLPYVGPIRPPYGRPGHWPGTMCMHDPYYYMHGEMHIEPCFHGMPMETAPIYTYDYDRNAYIPNYRGDNGLVLNMNYQVKYVLDIDITYENGEHLKGQLVEGAIYDFIYADEGVLKRDIGTLTKIKVYQGEETSFNARLGFDETTNNVVATLTFDCSSSGQSHIVSVDMNFLRSIVLSDRTQMDIASEEEIDDVTDNIDDVWNGTYDDDPGVNPKPKDPQLPPSDNDDKDEIATEEEIDDVTDNIDDVWNGTYDDDPGVNPKPKDPEPEPEPTPTPTPTQSEDDIATEEDIDNTINIIDDIFKPDDTETQVQCPVIINKIIKPDDEDEIATAKDINGVINNLFK